MPNNYFGRERGVFQFLLGCYGVGDKPQDGKESSFLSIPFRMLQNRGAALFNLPAPLSIPFRMLLGRRRKRGR